MSDLSPDTAVHQNTSQETLDATVPEIGGWRGWLLRQDRFIDEKYQPVHRYSFWFGFAACPVFIGLLMLLLSSLQIETALETSVGAATLLGIGVLFFLHVNTSISWSLAPRSDDGNFEFAYDRSRLPACGERGWISKRITAHYMCNVYPAISSAWMGWMIPAIVCTCIYYWWF